MKRLLLLLIVAGVVMYLVKSQRVLNTAPAEGGRGAPIERARAAAQASDGRTAAGEAMGREVDQPAANVVTENMTRDQVRRLLGSPDDVSSETTGAGAARETWTYKNVGKSVVFENGIVIGVQ